VELGLDIPDEIMTHPAMESILGLTADSVVLTNVGIHRSWLCVDQTDLQNNRIYILITTSKLQVTAVTTSSPSSCTKRGWT
jgi:hypothetical protein